MKMQALRIYKSGKQVLDAYNGGAKLIEPFFDSKQRLFERVFEATGIIYVFEEKRPTKAK